MKNMAKLITILAAFMLSACLLTAPAFADVANGAVFAMAVGIPVLLAALAIVLVALLIRAIRKRR